MDQGSGSRLCVKSCRAKIEVIGGDRIIEALHGALEPEIKTPPNPGRVSVTATHPEGRLFIEIFSRDIPSLRAALNSYIYLIYAVLRSLETAIESGER